MTDDTTLAILEHIHHSFKAASDSLPAYQHMLPFFESLFTLQAAAIPVTSPPPATVAPQMRAARHDGQLPMLDRSRLPYDEPAALGLLQAICAEAATATPQLSAAAAAIKASLENNSTAISRGLHMFMHDDLAGIHDLSAELSMDVSILLFFLHHSTWPSVARQAAMITEASQIDPNWDQGYCPVCGSPPGLAFLAENGGRVLVCEFCRHQWPFKRILCPFCGNADPDSITYFFTEGDPTYRVYTCDSCKKYIKTVDTRRMSRPFYPPLESIVTTHLDIKAQELGYQSGTSEAFG